MEKVKKKEVRTMNVLRQKHVPLMGTTKQNL